MEKVPIKTKQYTVFVVEDSDTYRTFLVEFISRNSFGENGDALNYEIYPFSCGEECLENLSLKPDVLILDYHLDSGGYINNMNGLTFLNKFKKLSPETEVVALSCQSDLQVIREMLNSGAGYYLKKDQFGQMKAAELIKKILVKKESGKHQKKVKIYKISAILFLISITLTLILLFL